MRLVENLLHFIDEHRDVPASPERLEAAIHASRNEIIRLKELVDSKTSLGDGQGRYEKALAGEQKHLVRLMTARFTMRGNAQMVR